MSSHRFGITKETVGRRSKELGHALHGWCADDGRFVNAPHGACFWA